MVGLIRNVVDSDYHYDKDYIYIVRIDGKSKLFQIDRKIDR